MSKVEKMYENVGVKKLLYCDICRAQEHALGLCAETKCEPFYPPFTAEKQLELIKWLAKSRPIHITFLIDKWVIEGMVRYGKRYDTFEDALSGYINNIWQDLTEQERTEIAEILN